ncbi:MAG: hypothetical protein ACK4K9_01810 [Bacteroidia bacterium]
MKKITLKPKRLRFLTILLIILTVINVTCKKKSEDKPEELKIPKYIDIVGAKSLFIGSSNSLQKNGTSNRIFKILFDTVVVEVKGTDENGNDITNSIQPTNICNLTSDYITATFYFPFGTANQPGGSQTFLVRKSDGAVFKGEYLIESTNRDGGIGPLQLDLIYEDKDGNIYYPYNIAFGSSDKAVFKLNIKNPLAPTVQKYSASTDAAQNFIVNKQGELIYNIGNVSNPIIRYRHPEKGFFNIDRGYLILLSDVNNENFYAVKTSYTGGETKTMLIFDNEKIDFVESPDTSGLLYPKNYCKIKQRNKILYYGQNRKLANDECLFEFTGSNPMCSKVITTNSLGLLNYSYETKRPIMQIIGTNNNYIILGFDAGLKKVIVKVDGQTHQVLQKKEVDKEFDILQLVAGLDDEILFYGLRMIDGKKVLASLGSNNVINVIKVFDDMEIKTLVRIN